MSHADHMGAMLGQARFYTLTYQTDAPLSIRAVFYIPEDSPNRWSARNQHNSQSVLHPSVFPVFEEENRYKLT